jgi:hypothetical protein
MKREQLLQELRKIAKLNGVTFTIFENEGKGSHYRVEYDGRKTTLKSGELTPGYVRLIKKQLGIE